MNYNDMNSEQRQAWAAKRKLINDAIHSVTEVSKLPDQAHYAVLVNESISRDDGYHGSYTTPYIGYIAFDTEDALEDWIIENHSKKTFKVINVKAVDFELKTAIRLRTD